MDEEFMIFVVLVTLVSGGLFLIFTKMILNFFKDRRRSKGASLGTGELEAMIQRAVETGTASLHDRLDSLEQRLDGASEPVAASPKALPEAQRADIIQEDAAPAPAEVRPRRHPR